LTECHFPNDDVKISKPNTRPFYQVIVISILINKPFKTIFYIAKVKWKFWYINSFLCILHLKGIAGVFLILFRGDFHWTLFMVLAFDTFGSLVRIRKLIKNNYFLLVHLENTVCVIRHKLSFIYVVFKTFAVTGGFYF